MANESTSNGYKQASVGRSNPPYYNDINAVMQSSFVIAPGAANTCTIQITMEDGFGVADLTAQPFLLWLSDSAAGVGVTSTTASGTVAASVGTDFANLIPKIVLLVQPNALGIYTLSITDTAKTGFYIALQNPFTGQLSISRQLVTADYG